jgi:hypothetical protein
LLLSAVFLLHLQLSLQIAADRADQQVQPVYQSKQPAGPQLASCDTSMRARFFTALKSKAEATASCGKALLLAFDLVDLMLLSSPRTTLASFRLRPSGDGKNQEQFTPQMEAKWPD